jgi:hypothetical protein
MDLGNDGGILSRPRALGWLGACMFVESELDLSRGGTRDGVRKHTTSTTKGRRRAAGQKCTWVAGEQHGQSLTHMASLSEICMPTGGAAHELVNGRLFLPSGFCKR